MAEQRKNPTPQELAACFIGEISHGRDVNNDDVWKGEYSYGDCLNGMDMTYLDKGTGWTPLTVAIARSGRYFNSGARGGAPYDGPLYLVTSQERVTLNDLLKTPGEKECALHYAVRWPETFGKLMWGVFLTHDRNCGNIFNCEWPSTTPFDDRKMQYLLHKASENPDYDEKRIFSPEFWKVVSKLTYSEKMFYRDCPGFKKRWLLEGYEYFKKNGKNIKDSYLHDALGTFKEVLLEDPKQQSKVDELKNSVRGLDINYECHNRYDYKFFPPIKLYDYSGMSAEYLQELSENYPNIERLSLPQFELSKREDSHYTIKNEIGDAHFGAISKFKKIKKLMIGYQPQMTSEAFNSVASMKSLESIAFHQMELKKEDLEKLLKLPHLQELDLSECKYDEELIRNKTDLLYIDGKWIGPKHPDYKKAQKLTGDGWKENFYDALKKGDKSFAFELLKQNRLIKIKEMQEHSSFSEDKEDIHRSGLLDPAGYRYGYFETKDSFNPNFMNFLDLGNGNIAVGFIYEDSNWTGRAVHGVAWGGGVGYSRSVEVAILNLDQKKLIAESERSKSVRWRDPYDSSKDISITNIDSFLKKEGNTVIAQLESHGRPLVSSSVEIPKTETMRSRLKEASNPKTSVAKKTAKMIRRKEPPVNG